MMSFTISSNAASSSLVPEALSFADPEVAAEVLRFHHSLPGYQPTPLVSLSALADRLGIERLLVKDESRRFDLNAFKPLGASYAMARSLAEKVGLGGRQLTYESLVAAIGEIEPQTFVTATDGNHGRAVAWAAELFGCQAEVFMPAGSSKVRLEAIRGHGAEASILERNYDQAVQHAERVASEKGGILLQDTAWQALSAGADAFAACHDEVAKQGMRIYGNPAGHDPRIVSGESGAVTLGLLKDILAGQGSNEAKRQLRLDRRAKVLLISSEGDTDPEFYRQVVWSCH